MTGVNQVRFLASAGLHHRWERRAHPAFWDSRRNSSVSRGRNPPPRAVSGGWYDWLGKTHRWRTQEAASEGMRRGDSWWEVAEAPRSRGWSQGVGSVERRTRQGRACRVTLTRGLS